MSTCRWLLWTGLVALCATSSAIISQPGTTTVAGPIQWCNPSSPLFDPYICYNETPHGGIACDPNGPAYDPNYCAAQSGTR
jgi:hypothetical protein